MEQKFEDNASIYYLSTPTSAGSISFYFSEKLLRTNLQKEGSVVLSNLVKYFVSLLWCITTWSKGVEKHA